MSYITNKIKVVRNMTPPIGGGAKKTSQEWQPPIVLGANRYWGN